MNKKKICFILLNWLFIASAFAQTPNILSKGKADSQECKDWVESRLEKMTLKEKIGQLFIIQKFYNFNIVLKHSLI